MADARLRSDRRRPGGRRGGCRGAGAGATAQGRRSLGAVLGRDAPGLASRVPRLRVLGHGVATLPDDSVSRILRVLLLYSVDVCISHCLFCDRNHYIRPWLLALLKEKYYARTGGQQIPKWWF